MKRWPEIDALRGFMLVMMTITHVPTRFSAWVGQPVGFVSAAEGFVFLSAFMASFIFSQRAAQYGTRAMLKAFLARAGKLYACHVAMLGFLFTVIALIGITTDRQAIKNLMSFYLQEPATAIVTSLLLLYNPPLLDILPMYVVFMIVSPLLLAVGLRWSWIPILAGGLILWTGAQFGMAREIYEAARDVSGFKVPYHETGAFDILAWQLVWLIGLWIGAQVAAGKEIHFADPVLWAAVVVAALGVSVRYVMGQAPFPEQKAIVVLLDKWRLGSFRLVNFLALIVVIIHFAPALKNIIRWRPLARLGAASLPVFCAHLVSVLLILALVGDKQGSLSLATELALLGGTFVVMFAATMNFRSQASAKRSAMADRKLVTAGGGR